MKDDTRDSYHQRILKVLLHIQQHLDEPQPLEALAQMACFSPYHFHRVFRGMVGETVAGHVRRLRLERAAHRLAATRRSVTELALEAGYETVESFTRAFRARFGQSPSRYRQIQSHGATHVDVNPYGRASFTLNTGYGGPMQMDVKIIDQPVRKVAFVRHVGPYDQCGPAWEKLCQWAGPQGLLGPQTCFLGLCYDDPEVTAPEKIRYDACISVDRPVTPAGEVGCQQVPAGPYAVTRHKGPMTGLKDTYAAFCGRWLPASGRELAHAPSVEVYLNDPATTPPEELLIEIQLPLV